MDSRLLDLERLLQNQINNKKIFNIVLAVASGDGRFVWSKAAGLANPEKNGDMRVDTPYYIASVTKIFTASAIMLLHEQGKINLDDPITSFLTKEQLDGIHICKGKDYSQDLKIYHLLSHTSGLADYFEQKNSKGESFFDRILQNGDIEWDVEKVLEIVRNDLEPNFPPALKPGSGHKAAYSDTNYQLLGAILENILGISLGQVFDKFFFKPLELLNTYLYGDDFSSSTRALPATIYNGKQLLNLPKALGSFWADGGIVSTAEEQNQFLEALFDGKIFKHSQTLVQMQQWNKIFFPLAYGFGLMRYQLPRLFSPFSRVPEFIGHAGASGSFAFYCAEGDFYISGTVNQLQSRSTSFQLMSRVADIVQKSS